MQIVVLLMGLVSSDSELDMRFALSNGGVTIALASCTSIKISGMIISWLHNNYSLFLSSRSCSAKPHWVSALRHTTNMHSRYEKVSSSISLK